MSGTLDAKRAAIVARAHRLFPSDGPPPMTLRGGDAVDSYYSPPPFDAGIDAISTAYLDGHHDGIAHLDPVSWRHYLPHLLEHALRTLEEPYSMTVEYLLWSLRPPDREPPRLGSLSEEQEEVVRAFLHVLGFDDRSPYQDLACQVLEEWWIPGALYRTR